MSATLARRCGAHHRGRRDEEGEDDLGRFGLSRARLAVDHDGLRAAARLHVVVRGAGHLVQVWRQRRPVRWLGRSSGSSRALVCFHRASLVQPGDLAEGIERDEHWSRARVDLARGVSRGDHVEERGLVEVREDRNVFRAIERLWIGWDEVLWLGGEGLRGVSVERREREQSEAPGERL
eukprot:scaffold120594_cov22-Tisochrysis_lutea.AAC.4